MDNELYKLCKQVYEATGWENDRYVKHLNKAPNYECRYHNASIYTSDYLLEKLPRQIEAIPLSLWAAGRSDWRAEYDGTGQFDSSNEQISAISDTPLKALLKLTIALSEAGELK